jgi:hypothetical protein
MSTLILGVPRTLDIGLCAVADEVLLLAVLNVLLETLMILGAAGLVAVIGDREQGVEGIGAHAALHTAANAVADEPGHELLLQQVLHRLVDMGGAVVHGAVGLLYHADIPILGVVGGVIALLHNVGAADDPVSEITVTIGTVNLLAVQVDIGLHGKKPSFVLLISSDCHVQIPPRL